MELKSNALPIMSQSTEPHHCINPQYLECVQRDLEKAVAHIESMERRLAQHEVLIGLMTWLQASKYRSIQHRHTGDFRALDESTNQEWNAERFDTLYNLIYAGR